jgi:hypothetical protein
MTGDSRIFEFERDFAGLLQCIPMDVRLKLDLCGIKLSLHQWSCFTPAERFMLLEMDCETPADVCAIRQVVSDLVVDRAKETPKDIAVDEAPPWLDVSQVPPLLSEYARSVGMSAPTAAQWRNLTRLQRFALLKLTRDQHDNMNFAPAMVEFGLSKQSCSYKR